VGEAVERLEESIVMSKAASWDAVGLQIGDPAGPAQRVGVCHEVNADVVSAARAEEIDLLVAYHPLLFAATKRLVAGSGPAGRAYTLASAGTALYVVHTAFDVAPGGCADSLASALSLDHVSGFGPAWSGESAKVVAFVPEESAEAVAAAMAVAGGGHIGRYSACSFRVGGTGMFRPGGGARPFHGDPGRLSTAEEVRVEMIAPNAAVDHVVAALVDVHPYDEAAFDVYPVRSNAGFVGRVGRLPNPVRLGSFTAAVEAALHAPVRYAGDATEAVERVAVVPGSGSDLIPAAVAAGADVLVTGDVSHHRAVAAADRGLAVVDAGHAATERPGIARLYSLVAATLDGALDLTHIDANPWEIG